VGNSITSGEIRVAQGAYDDTVIVVNGGSLNISIVGNSITSGEIHVAQGAYDVNGGSLNISANVTSQPPTLSLPNHPDNTFVVG
jgi:hypothetical protein